MSFNSYVMRRDQFSISFESDLICQSQQDGDRGPTIYLGVRVHLDAIAARDLYQGIELGDGIRRKIVEKSYVAKAVKYQTHLLARLQGGT